jgi:hypothetical protein
MLGSAGSDHLPFVERLTARSVLSDQECHAILNLPTRASQVFADQPMGLKSLLRLQERAEKTVNGSD